MIKREEILKYVKNKYDTIPEYLWEKYPRYAVLRHRDNKKWYAVIMEVEKEKIGLKGNEKVDIINIKCYPEMIGSLRKEKGIFPAYHMKKEHWVSIMLESDFLKENLLQLLDISFDITRDVKK